MVDLIGSEAGSLDLLIDEKMTIVTMDKDFEVISGNNAILIYTRYIHPDDVSRFMDAIRDCSEVGKYIVIRMLYQTGEYHWMLTRIIDGGVSEERGHLHRINIIDTASITSQIDDLNARMDKYSSYLGMCENVLFSYDIIKDDFNIFMISDGQQTMSFYEGSVEHWKDYKINTDALDNQAVQELEAFIAALINGEKFFKREITISVLNNIGRLDRCLVRGKTIIDNSGNKVVIGTINILESSDNHVVEELSIISDMKDPGTDLLNKRAITDYVRKLIDSKPDHNVTIAIIDVDDFKTVNDTYGHKFGDTVLVNCCNVMSNLHSGEFELFRYVGEEIVVLLKDKSKKEVIMIAESIRRIIEDLIWEEEVKVTASLGIAYSEECGYKTLEIADKNLYKAKNSGKNRVVFN